MNIGKTIRTRRRAIHMTQFECARIADISQTYLSQVESGKKKATIDTLESIAKALNYYSLELLMLHAVDRKDVPEDRRELFDLLEEPLKAMIKQMSLPEDRYN